MLQRIRNTPTWIKVFVSFLLGSLASSPLQNFCNLLYKDNAALFTGNITLIAEKLDMTGGQLLFNVIVGLILLGLFGFLTWTWTRKDDSKTIDDKLNMILEKMNDGKKTSEGNTEETKKGS